MKSLLLISLVTLTTISCRKDASIADNVNFSGSWKFVYAVGGLTGKKINASANTIQLLKLNTDKSYLRLINNQVISKGKYNISTQNGSGVNSTLITYDASAYWQFISLQNDSLYTNDPFPDGYGTVYVREK